jgi:hypothetical protein
MRAESASCANQDCLAFHIHTGAFCRASRSVTGLVLLNVGFLLVGQVLLWGLRAFRGPVEALAMAGLAHLVGTASVVLLTIQLVIVGTGLSWALGVSLSIVGTAGVVARRLSLGELGAQQLKVRWQTAPAIVVIAPMIAFAVLLLRLAPTLGVWEPDAISTWTMRAKSLYFSNGLDAQTLHSVGAFAYPLYESMLQGLDFLAIGGANDLMFHVQFAILLLSFIGAVAAISYRVGAPFYAIWPILGLFLISPQVGGRGLTPLADLTLDYFFAAAVLYSRCGYGRGHRGYSSCRRLSSRQQ